MQYVQGLLWSEAQLLDEEAMKECLSIGIVAPVTLQMTDSEMCGMVVD
jgi:hypothetical protein